jgi:hypothetical protein
MDSHRETRVGIEPPAANEKALKLEAQTAEVENKRDKPAPEV